MAGREDEYSPSTMDDLLGSLAAGARVLDLGCGRGSFPYGNFQHLRIDALDEFPISSAAAFPTHVRYRQGRAEALPYDAAAFDLIIANFVLEHVTDFPASIDEIARVLKPAGYFYMAVPNARSFEDALYRSLYAGGGHTQRHSFESVLATIYARTSLKLISYIEWPGGFTYLAEHEGLRALVAQVDAACRESLGLDIRARSNYLFVFQAQHGRGRPIFRAVCGYCGAGASGEITPGQDWTCQACGRTNVAYPAGSATDERLDADMRALWARNPYLRPTFVAWLGRRARAARRLLRRRLP